MDSEKMDLIVQWLASECQEAGEDLDALESQVTERLQELGQRTMQKVLDEKKGAMAGPRCPVSADGEPGLSAIDRKSC